VVVFDAKLWKNKKVDNQIITAEKYVFPN
jgi:hypothetical protein